ncbi:MAG: penicillin-binding protein 1C [Rubrivivax sp.]
MLRHTATRPGRAPRAWLAGVILLAGFAGFHTRAHAVPSFEEVRAAHRPSDHVLLDRHGTPLQTLRTDLQVRRLAWVPLADMSPALLQAVVLSEDRRFWAHSGVDWAAVARSAFGNLWNTRTRGASTVTMQLAGLTDDGLARPAGGRSLGQKLGQVVVASRLEASWSKHQILEAYLNSVPLRGERVGIHALARTLFGKHPGGLDALEAAITAALARAPNAAPETVARRACGVLQEMKLDCAGVATLTGAALARQGNLPLGEQLAPHYARLALRSNGPPAQRSTLDAGLQRVAVRALRQQLAELAGHHVEDGAAVVLDNATGEVLAWVGANGDTSDAPQVDGVLARRQAGSTLKPFVYALAFEQRLLTPDSLLEDTHTALATGSGLYRPQNYDRSFKGWVSARTALGSSLNVPAVRVGTLLPPDALHARLNALGLALPHTAGWYGSALVLGSADVSLLALTNAYRALANGGRYTPAALPHPDASGRRAAASRGADEAAGPSSAAGPAPARRVGDAASAFLVTEILADNAARALTFGLDSALATRGFAAVKTGTSKDMRDNWCIGYTDRYTVGVWVGNASGEPMHAVSGVSGAAPVWRTLVQHLHAGRVSRALPPPAGLPLAGTAPRATQPAALAAPPEGRAIGISSPVDGSVYALDPDVPPTAQRITFEGEAGTWVLDGRPLGRGSTLHWAPWPGRHVLSLRDAQGRVRQTVQFEVRGATLRAGAEPGTQPGRGTRPAGGPSGKTPVQEPAPRLVLARQP